MWYGTICHTAFWGFWKAFSYFDNYCVNSITMAWGHLSVFYIWIFNVDENRYGVGSIVPGVTVLQNGWWIVGPLV